MDPISGTTQVEDVVTDLMITPYGLPPDPNTGNPQKFIYGFDWVEALVSYMEQTTSASDTSSAWKCPSALNTTFTIYSSDCGATVTYAMNYNLVEQTEGDHQKS